MRRLFGFLLFCFAAHAQAQTVDLSVHGFRSDVTVPISDLSRRSLEYAYHLESQASGMDFSASVANAGPDTAFNVLVQMLASLDGEDLGTYHSDTIPELAPGQSDTVAILAGLDIAASDVELSLLFTVLSQGLDTVTTNDQDFIAIHINPFLFSRNELEWSDTIGNGEAGSKFFVRYEFLQPEWICMVTCIIPFDLEQVGNPIEGGLYDGDFNLIASTYEFTLTQSSMSEPGETIPVHLEFPGGPIEVVPGQDYYAAIVTWVPMAEGLAAGGPSVDSSAFRYDWATDSWLMLARTPYISLVNPDIGCYFAVEERDRADLRVRPCTPNPASVRTTLQYSIRSASNVRLEVKNSSGMMVDFRRLGQQPPGEHTFDLDVSALPAGVYAYSLILDSTRATRRMVVVH